MVLAMPEAGTEQSRISQREQPAPSLQQLLGKGHTPGGTWIQLQFLHGISRSTNGTRLWFCQGRSKSPEESMDGICSELQSCPALCEV